MTSEEQQNEMSMEDILSSIKDILESDSQEELSNDDNDSLSETKAQPEEKTVEAMPVSEESEDDVFDLSKSMIVENLPETEPKTELDETGPDFDVTTSEDPLLSPDDIELPDFEKEDAEAEVGLSSTEDFSAEKANTADDVSASPEDDFDFNIDDILQSASDAIAQDTDVSFSEPEDLVPTQEEKTENNMPELLDVADVDITSDPIFSEETEALDFSATTLEEQNPSFMEENKIEFSPEESLENVEEKTIPVFENSEEQDNSVMPVNEIPAAVDEEPQEIPEAEFSEIEENSTSEPEILDYAAEQKTEVKEKEDAADVSADIINNFAKMFAEQTQEHQDKVIEEKHEVPVNVSGMGDGNKTIEQVVEGVIQGIVASSVSAEMTKNVDIVAYAQKVIHAQTRAWLEANLPAIVEAAVQKEIERVMAKVGK